jgi:hypothetical protein
VPLLASLALRERELMRRLVTIAAVIFGGVALLVSMERRAWFSVAAGALVG